MNKSVHDPKTTKSAKPVGHEGAKVEITERRVWALNPTFSLIALISFLVLLTLDIFLFVKSAIALASAEDAGLPAQISDGIGMGISITAFVLLILASTGFTIVSPGHTRVVQFFGKYIGTLRQTGLSYTVPLSSRAKVSARVQNFETNQAKVNDFNGNPINTAAIIVWQVADTAKAIFSVEKYEKFIKSQAESALRHIATQHPYDSPVDGRISLRGSTDEVSQELAKEVAARVAVAGLEIIETRISSLSYAPEIAQAMLQRQQASAIVDARETIVEGAVSMVQQALEELEAKDIVELDPERKAAMVSNLLVVLCSDGNAQPVINAGGIYS
ncbi:SPFH domain-containing protein [Arcanobacterium hippocoleae]